MNRSTPTTWKIQFSKLKMVSRKQRYLCQKIPLPIPIQTWKISWIEWLKYFLQPHMANWSHLTLMNMEKRHMSHNSVYHFFLHLPSSHTSQAFEKNASVDPFDLTVKKKEHPFSRSTLPFEKNLHLFSRSTLPFKKIYIHSPV